MPRRQTNSRNSSFLVLFRDQDGLSESRALLSKAKKPFILIRSLQIDHKKFKLKSKSYDFILITSAHAADALRKNIKKNIKLKSLSVGSWIAIGKRSAGRLRSFGIRKIKILDEGNTNGIQKFFKKYSNKTIFYPRSSLAEKKNLKFLNSACRKLEAPIAYSTKILSVRKDLKKIFKGDRSFIFLLMSPSGVTAVKKSANKNELRKFVRKWIAIGPTTAKAIQKLGFRSVISSKPDLISMLNANTAKVQK